MSKNIVFEGWLTKSPPTKTKRFLRTKWRRRWFALRQSGELPGQYFLDYYADRNCRRLKGTINLDLCEQVDAGLHMERTGNVSLDPKLRGSVFTIQTQSRTYHLEAESEADMEKWVNTIIRVCGLHSANADAVNLDNYHNNVSNLSTMADTTGPYIPISECITGVRSQGGRTQRAFTFDTENIVRSSSRSRRPFERGARNQLYMSQPHIKLTHVDFSDHDSRSSEEECKSLNASQSNIRDRSVRKQLGKLAISPCRNEFVDGPPVPPRPPKTLKNRQQQSLHVSQVHHSGIQEANPTNIDTYISGFSTRVPRRVTGPPRPPSPRRAVVPMPMPMPGPGGAPAAAVRHSDDDDDDERIYVQQSQTAQYCNVGATQAQTQAQVHEPPPPAVDRALKPRHSAHIQGSFSLLPSGGAPPQNTTPLLEEAKADGIQYLDLDLPTVEPSEGAPTGGQEAQRKNSDTVRGKSPAADADDADCAYKTVDFVKTEAFNITRQDAEALRSFQS